MKVIVILTILMVLSGCGSDTGINENPESHPYPDSESDTGTIKECLMRSNFFLHADTKEETLFNAGMYIMFHCNANTAQAEQLFKELK